MEIPIDMDAQSYNRNPLSANNDFSDDSRHLVINCAGCCVLPQAFCTYSPHGRNDYYLMYLYAGQLALSSGARDNGGTLTLNAGQLFVFPPHTAFRYENGGNGEIRYLYVHFTGYGAAGLLADCAIPVGAVCSVGFPSDAEEKYRALFRLFILRGPCFDTAAAARFMDICVMFGRALAKESAKPSGPDRAGKILRKTHLYIAVLSARKSVKTARNRNTCGDGASGGEPLPYAVPRGDGDVARCVYHGSACAPCGGAAFPDESADGGYRTFGRI